MLNLDIEMFKVDYNSEVCRNKINRDIQEGIRLEIEGTPTAFLNGRKLNKLSENSINLLVKFLK
jgi:protein-disulfide isomerase